MARPAETTRRRGLPLSLGVVLLALIIGPTGCDTADAPAPPRDPVVAFDTGAVTLVTAEDTIGMRAELAVSASQRAHGLMERASLPENAGMLFVYPAPQDSASTFYMFRTRIPLDIAFLDSEGRILAIQAMEPCESPDPRSCRRYGPGRPFSAALEVNRGFFDRHGVNIGDRVLWEEE